MGMEKLSAIALAIVTLALIIGVGTAVLVKFGSTATTDVTGSNSEIGYINQTGFRLNNFSLDTFVPTITSVSNNSQNGSAGYLISSGNYTLNSNFIVYNITGANWNNATINYTYTHKVRGDGYTTISNLKDNLGTSGLAGWVPALIAVVIGFMILGYFGFAKGRKY